MQSMLALYEQYSEQNGVLAVPKDYDQRRQVALNGIRDRYRVQILLVLLAIALMLPFYLYRRSVKRGKARVTIQTGERT